MKLILDSEHLVKNCDFKYIYDKIKEYPDENFDIGYVEKILKIFIHTLKNNNTTYTYFCDISCCTGRTEIGKRLYSFILTFYNINSSFYNAILNSPFMNNQYEGNKIKIRDHLGESIFAVYIYPNYISCYEYGIDDFGIYNDKIETYTPGSYGSGVFTNVLKDGRVYRGFKKGAKYLTYPISLKKLSNIANRSIFYYNLFLCFFNVMEETYPLYKDIKRNFIEDPDYVSCNFTVNEAMDYHSYQDWIMRHYKTVKTLPKSINKEKLQIAVNKALACRYVEENYQQQIYNMDMSDYDVHKQTDVLEIYYYKRLKKDIYYLKKNEYATELTYEEIIARNWEDEDRQVINDYIKMIITLNRKINMKTTSFSKLKVAHNELVNPYMKKMAHKRHCAKMTIPRNSVFRKIKLPDNFEIIKTGNRLYLEGVTMHHCVYSYLHSVNKGKCIIAHLVYENIPYTLEIRYSYKKYKCVQMHGIWDSIAPPEVWNYVQSVLEDASRKQLQ